MKAKLQWLKDTSQINADKLNNVRHEIINISETKKRKCMKSKINELKE